MKFFESCSTALTHLLNLLTFSSFDNGESSQQPLSVVSPSHSHGPRFRVPHGPEGSHFTCDYSGMQGWSACSTPEDRSCWLRGPYGEAYNLETDYERFTPNGTLRQYQLDVSSMTLHPDGFRNLDGKVFNKQYPGPWIQACWGDTIEVTVTNNLQYNGTAVHWHGIRQLGTTEMDGVNGVTQCPIAPKDTFTYRFRAEQYGTSWYHSHYSLQYADGLLGPLTIYGPTSSNFDEALDPLIVRDWNHRSAFTDFYKELGINGSRPPQMTSIVLNKSGKYNCTSDEQAHNCTTPPPITTKKVKKGKRYLLRLINSSVDNTFIFAVDNHNLTVIESDFVQIEPYNTNSVLVGIGQRYHVILEANPIDDNRPIEDQNYWIRTVPAVGCTTFSSPQDNRTGILRYEGAVIEDPTTTIAQFSTACSDEPYDKLVPVVPWQVGLPVNNVFASGKFDVGLTTIDPSTNTFPGHGNVSRWDLGTLPLWLNLSDPTVLHFNDPSHVYAQELEVTQESGPLVTEDSWVWLLVTANSSMPVPGKQRIPAAHPIHLHGHDFAILDQSSTPWTGETSNVTLSNPPRRDVALLPKNGYLLIAFKADNPGMWLMHCHIAWHASSGLSLQIMERQGDIFINQDNMAEVKRVCDNWDTWFGDINNHWSPKEFQEDSGI